MGNKIDKFLAKPVEVEIGGEKYNLTPFTVNDIAMITRMSDKDPEVSSKGIMQAIEKVMKQIDPEATEEQIGRISIEYLTEIMEAIGKVNNLDTEKAKAELISRIKEQRL